MFTPTVKTSFQKFLEEGFSLGISITMWKNRMKKPCFLWYILHCCIRKKLLRKKPPLVETLRSMFRSFPLQDWVGFFRSSLPRTLFSVSILVLYARLTRKELFVSEHGNIFFSPLLYQILNLLFPIRKILIFLEKFFFLGNKCVLKRFFPV